MIRLITATLLSAFLVCSVAHGDPAPASAASTDVPLPFELKKIDGATLLAKGYQKVAQFILSGQKEDAGPVGQVSGLFYHVPSTTIPTEIITTYTKDLQTQGFQVMPRKNMYNYQIGDLCHRQDQFCGYTSELFLKDERDVTLKKTSADGDVIVAINAARIAMTRDWKKGNSAGALMDRFTFAQDENVVLVRVLLPKVTSISLVKENTNFMRDALNKEGHVNLYGIYFDFNKTDIKPESAQTLSQIAGLLKDDPTLSLRVIGHTDNVGAAEYNQKLSEGRASAVVANLVQQYGVDSKRLIASGKGASTPIASNDTEEGRAKNRRVELAKAL